MASEMYAQFKALGIISTAEFDLFFNAEKLYYLF